LWLFKGGIRQKVSIDLLRSFLGLSADIDTDAQAYFTAVQNNGGAIPEEDRPHWDMFFKSIKSDSSLWNAIKELRITQGGFNGAFVAQKVPGGVNRVAVNNGFVSADWTKTGGLKGGGTKWVDPQSVAPSTLGIHKDNLFFQFFHMGKNITTSHSHAPTFGSNNSTGGQVIYAGTAIGLRPVYEITNLGCFTCGLINNATGGSIFGEYVALKNNTGVSSSTSLFDSPFTWFRTRNNGTYEYMQGNSMGYVYGTAITQSQYDKLTTILYNLFYNIGALPNVKDAVFVGDSITYGMGAGTRFSQLVSTSLGLRELNNGRAGAGALDFTSITFIPSFVKHVFHDTEGNRNTDVFILYAGMNNWTDFNHATNGAANRASFKQFLKDAASTAKNAGVSPDKICLCIIQDNSWGGTASQQDAVAQVVREAASESKVRCADLLTAFRNNGGHAALSTDGIHPNATGHQLIANTIIAALA
jgi:lysophospholipase L1-like esterase